MTASAGGRTVVMLKDQHTLFERDPPSGANSPGTGGCPGLVPFSFMMPTTFQYEESSTEHPLPPSMRIPVDVDGPSLHLAEIQYSLTFIVANRVSALGFEFATNNHTYVALYLCVCAFRCLFCALRLGYGSRSHICLGRAHGHPLSNPPSRTP